MKRGGEAFARRDYSASCGWNGARLSGGSFRAIESRTGPSPAALHTPAWARLHLDDARLLLLYSRHDFVQGDWPKTLKRGVRDQAQRFEGLRG